MQQAPPSGPTRSRASLVMFVALLLGSLFALLYLLSSFVTEAVIGFMLAGLSRPLYERLLRRGMPTWSAAALVSVMVAVAIVVPTSFLATSLTKQATRAYYVASASLATGELNTLFFGDGFWAQQLRHGFEALGMEYSATAIRLSLGQLASNAAGVISNQVNIAVSNLFGGLYHFVMLLVIVYYGLIDGERLKRGIFELSPLPEEEEQLIVDKFSDVGKAILFGNGIGSAAQGVLGALSMWLCGVSSPVFWGTVMTLFAFLPLAGISVVVVPVTLFLGFSGHWMVALLFAGFNLLQALVIENVVKTKLIGDRMHMNGALVFFSLLGGLSTFGIVGILYGPLILALFMTANELYDRVYKDVLLAQ